VTNLQRWVEKQKYAKLLVGM